MCYHITVNTGDTPKSTPQEDELASRLKRGEPAAVVLLYETYFDRIYTSVFHQVAEDHNAAQDIVQETFLAALKSVGKFRGESRPYTWLYSIAHKKVIDFYRRRSRDIKRETKLSENLAAGHDGDPTDDGPSELVQQTLNCLPLHYRQVLMLKYAEEMPVTEIGRIMGRSPKSVEGLLSRARKELRNKLMVKSEG
jgi:RNA polymerase sigma-70 factor (ECF subfamily)